MFRSSEVAAKEAYITEVGSLRQAFCQEFFTLPSARLQVLDPPSRCRAGRAWNRSGRPGAILIIPCGGNQQAAVIGNAATARPVSVPRLGGRWNAVFVAVSGDRLLASRPQGAPTAADFRLEQATLPALAKGEVLLRNRYLSLDPYMRGRMDEGPSYAAPVAINAVMEGQTVAEVLQSKADGVSVGDLVLAPGGWQTHAVLPGKALGRRLDPAGLPLSTALGVYGMPGFTAYSSLHEIARLKPGETLVVAAATGPVGATVAQLAKLQGARVVAIAGGEAKRAYLQTLGVDVALDHRAADFAEQLRAAVPAGIDVYFENVGGHVLDAVLPLLNDFARIPVCGTIATYNERGVEQPGPDRLPALFSQILRQRLTVRGFIVHDFNHLWPDFEREMPQWLREGRIQYREDVVEGLENAPEAFFGLLKGQNFGKLVVKLD
ncbi:NADP-dependent oxidoreductase [Stenotrophomonas maltophilia]|nr:NADP-dependent oxidoreductase [Stenotrophomonas maltophilia]OWB44181.1 NADP-dependent oxidoreductase [Stenotrophomonas maltophilia]REC84787.1 NADP-dependent oxidoreductase [Stenotrophomonas maltophilia]SSM88906.1 dehydrogenase [Acinetobacter baumannii]